jgi:hypothetical protein
MSMVQSKLTARGARWRDATVGLLVLTVGLTTGCVGTTGHLAAATTRDVDARDMVSDAPARHVTGRSCIDVLFLFPTALPSFGDAIEDALRKSGGRVLTDVTIRYELVYFPFVYGNACYVAEGDAR